MLALSSTFCTRLISVARSLTNVLRKQGQFAQLSLPDRGNEAGFQQAMLHQFGDPFRIILIGLPTRYFAEMLGVHQDHFKVGLQDVEDRFPVFCCTLHRTWITSWLINQSDNSSRSAVMVLKLRLLLMPTTIRPLHYDRYHYHFLVHIQASDPLIDDPHLSFTPFLWIWADMDTCANRILLFVLPSFGSDN